MLDIFSLSYLTVAIGIPTLIHSIYYSSYTWKAVRNMPPLVISLIGCTLGKAQRLPQDALIILLTNLTVKLNNIISLLSMSSTLSVMIVISAVFRQGICLLANFQKLSQPSLSSFPNTIPNATGIALQFAVMPYKYIRYTYQISCVPHQPDILSVGVGQYFWQLMCT